MKWTYERIGGNATGKEKGMLFRIVDPNQVDPQKAQIALVYYKPLFENALYFAQLIALAPRMIDVIYKLAMTRKESTEEMRRMTYTAEVQAVFDEVEKIYG